jgi:hypothetical protein
MSVFSYTRPNLNTNKIGVGTNLTLSGSSFGVYKPLRQFDTKQIALSNLSKALAKHTEISKETRDRSRDEMAALDDLSIMNMGILASALVMYIYSQEESISGKVFKMYINRAIEPLLPPENTFESKSEYNQFVLRIKIDVYRYIKKIEKYREEFTI